MSRHNVKAPTVMNILGISDETQRFVRSCNRQGSRHNVIAPKISSALFSLNSDRRGYTEELSTLEANGGRVGQLWNDSCDEGFTIVSGRTGQEADFQHDHDDRDAEGELQGSYYVPTRETLHRLPHLAGFTVLIIND